MKLKDNIAVSDSGYLFNPSTGESFVINPLGKEILDHIREGKSSKEIKKIIAGKYIVDDATVDKDCVDFLHILRQYLIIETDES